MLTDEQKDVWRRLGTEPEFMQLDQTFGQFRLRIHDDVPSFMEVPIAYEAEGLAGADVAFLGVPFEGWRHFGPTIWYSVDRVGDDRAGAVMGVGGDALAPDYLRRWSLHYSIHVSGGYFPEVAPDFRLVDHLTMKDYGNVDVVQEDSEATARRAIERLSHIAAAGAVPVVFGGDHSTPYSVVKAIDGNSDGKIGLLVFDSHYDNMYGGAFPAPYEVFGRLNGANQFYKILEQCDAEPRTMAIIGVKGGAFNTAPMRRLAEEVGITVFTAGEVERAGIAEVVERALGVVTDGTDRVYVSLDVDSIDANTMTAQKYPDPFGLTARQVRYALQQVATRTSVCGFDINGVSPVGDAGGRGALTACRFVLEVLKGMAIRKAGVSFEVPAPRE